MQLKIVWQQGSSNPENISNLAQIRDWWASINGKEISWRQRLISQTGDVSELDWEPQRFDEKFLISNCELRGITLYWRKPDSQQERSTMPHKLELDTLHQQLYIYPQSQKQIVMRVGVPEVVFQKLELKNPQLQINVLGEKCNLVFQDKIQQIEVKINLSPENIEQIKQLIL